MGFGPDMPGYGMLSEPPGYSDDEEPTCDTCGETEDDCKCEDKFVAPEKTNPGADCPSWCNCKGKSIGMCLPEQDEDR